MWCAFLTPPLRPFSFRRVAEAKIYDVRSYLFFFHDSPLNLFKFEARSQTPACLLFHLFSRITPSNHFLIVNHKLLRFCLFFHFVFFHLNWQYITSNAWHVQRWTTAQCLPLPFFISFAWLRRSIFLAIEIDRQLSNGFSENRLLNCFFEIEMNSWKWHTLLRMFDEIDGTSELDIEIFFVDKLSCLEWNSKNRNNQRIEWSFQLHVYKNKHEFVKFFLTMNKLQNPRGHKLICHLVDQKRWWVCIKWSNHRSRRIDE